MKIVSVLFVCCLIIHGGCSKENTNNKDTVNEIEVDFVWDLKNLQRSPEIHLTNIPNDTSRLDFQFFDATNEWEHGGGSVLYNGSSIIPAGALNGFKGLSSNWGVPKVRLIVEAFNNSSQLVGKGTITKSPPES